MNARASSLLVPAALVCAAAWLVADHVVARGSGPDSGERVIPYSGRLEHNGNAVSSAGVPMTFTLRGVMEGGGAQTWSYGPVGVDVANGAFSVRIGEGASVPGWVYEAAETYVTVAVNDVPLTGEQRIYPVPFATFAAESSDLFVAGSLTVTGPIVGTSLTTTGDILNTAADGQLATSAGFAFRDTGDTWLRLRTGPWSSSYADLAIGKLHVESTISASSADIGGTVAANNLCVGATCGNPYITCSWSGGRWVHGDGGCADDVLITCLGGRVTHLSFSC